MAEKGRISGESVDIDYDATRKFFDGRCNKTYASALSTTMYQDDNPQLVEQRDQTEKDIISQKIDRTSLRKVFDVGCGIGRWGWFWAAENSDIAYQGIDFSQGLIDSAIAEASKRSFPNLQFQQMSAVDITPAKLAVLPPYDLVIISGLLIYLNDQDCLKMLQQIAEFTAPNGQVYIREPVAVEQRLTLNQFYSEELADDYSAIYRNETEMQSYIEQAFGDNFHLVETGPLFPDNLEKRAQTRQHFFILQKG
jgi:2-polyprenyl-3-methyl-5-hydroxy-6-metoxy-1,4-benzoquinol methylase